MVLPNFKRKPSAGALKIGENGGNCDFRLKSPFISETVRNETGVVVAMER